jgi:exonuclease III
LKLIAWNIQHGGGARLERIVEEISAYDPDVVAVTEFRQRPGIGLCAALKDRGLVYAATTNPTGNQNGIAVFSRVRLHCAHKRPAPRDYRARWLDVNLLDDGFGIGVLHIMAAGSSKTHPMNIAKVQFWNAVLRAAKARIHEPFLLIGDWNTGAHRVDEAGKTYVCSEHFCRLSDLGWTDIWRLHNPSRTEWTWYSTLKGGVRGNGFRLDHAFATPPLMPRITGCEYSHREREARVSDHSMVIVEIR